LFVAPGLCKRAYKVILLAYALTDFTGKRCAPRAGVGPTFLINIGHRVLPISLRFQPAEPAVSWRSWPLLLASLTRPNNPAIRQLERELRINRISFRTPDLIIQHPRTRSGVELSKSLATRGRPLTPKTAEVNRKYPRLFRISEGVRSNTRQVLDSVRSCSFRKNSNDCSPLSIPPPKGALNLSPSLREEVRTGSDVCSIYSGLYSARRTKASEEL
ncbi:hypothetical protein J6590_090255, partial [Homalodisca vitripennis]